MNWFIIFYLMTVSGRVSDISGTIAVLCVIFAGISGMIGLVLMTQNSEFGEDDGDYKLGKNLLKQTKRVAIAAAVLGLLYSLVPQKKDWLLIVGGGSVGEYVSNSEEIKGLPDDIVKHLRSELQAAKKDNEQHK